MRSRRISGAVGRTVAASRTGGWRPTKLNCNLPLAETGVENHATARYMIANNGN